MESKHRYHLDMKDWIISERLTERLSEALSLYRLNRNNETKGKYLAALAQLSDYTSKGIVPQGLEPYQ